MAKELKVALDAGHGVHTAGKRTPDGEREWSFNNVVVTAMEAEFKQYEGVETKRLDDPTGQRDVPLIERTNTANSWGADILIDYHHNANSGKWGTHTGTETYMYNGTIYDETIKLAEVVHNSIVEVYKLRNRGIKRANFHMLREANMPAALAEGGYMDSTIDIKVMRNNAILKNAGIKIAQNVAEHYGMKRKKGVNVSKPVVKPAPTPAAKPVANKTESIVDYLNSIKVDSSPTNRKKIAAVHGISNYTGTAAQNTKLLESVKNNGVTPKKTTTQTAGKKYQLPNATYWVKKPVFSGTGVRQVQEALASIYFYPEKGAKNNGIDGYYGAKTADAVKRFQSVNGLKADGDYGPATKKALDKKANK